MASRRQLKKEIDYLAGELISNSYACLYFHPDKNREKIIEVIEDAVEYRNDLFSKIRPAEKNNRSLVKKHYAALRGEMLSRIDELFQKLSEACR